MQVLRDFPDSTPVLEMVARDRTRHGMMHMVRPVSAVLVFSVGRWHTPLYRDIWRLLWQRVQQHVQSYPYMLPSSHMYMHKHACMHMHIRIRTNPHVRYHLPHWSVRYIC
jgi:hypothetical protein